MNEQATAEQMPGNALSDDDLARVVGGSGDPIEGGRDKTGAH